MQKAKISISFVQNTSKHVIFDHPYAPFNKKSILNQLAKFRDRFVIMLDVGGPFSVPERNRPSGIMDSFFIATDCFLVNEFVPCILFSSITVECVLNHDSRLYEFRKKQPNKWIDLSIKNLRKAREVGIDVSDLLETNSKNQITSDFVIKRNKIAHGDMPGYFSLMQKMIKDPNNLDEIMEAVMVTEKQALNQLRKCFEFVKKWGESKPTIILDGNEQIDFGGPA